LYLKYDKKLILEAEQLVVDYVSSDEKVSVDDLKKRFLQIPKVLDYIEKIDIERLKLKNNEFTILIDKEDFYLDSKDINISAKLEFVKNQLDMEIYSIYLKEQNLTLFGESKVDANKGIINFFGFFNKDDMDGELNLKITEELLDFFVNTTHEIKSLKFLKDMFRLDEVAEAWMYDNVEGDINLNYLYGQIDLKKQEAILDSIKGQAVIKDAKIRFHENAQTVDTPLLTIDYYDDTLYFDLEKPMYSDSEIYGSKVYIPNLTSEEKGMVVVDLKTKSMLNDNILEILNAYDINLPLKQIDGESNSSLILKIPYMASKEMQVDGKFVLNNANLKLNNFEFYTKKAEVILKDNDVFIKKSFVKHKDLIEGDLTLDINTKTSIAKGNLDVLKFNLMADDKSILKLSGKTIPLKIDFKNETKIDLDTLKSKIEITAGAFILDVNDISLLYDDSELLQEIGIKVGDLQVTIKDENDISFITNAKELEFPFEKNGKKITQLKAFGTINDKFTKIKTNDSDIEIVLKEKQTPLIKLSNIDLVVNQDSKVANSLPVVNLQLKNSQIKIDNSMNYKVNWAKIYLDKEKISFEAEAKELDLPFKMNGKKVHTLVLKGLYKNDLLKINSKDNNLKLEYRIEENKVNIALENYDLIYDTNEDSTQAKEYSYFIKGKNSNIIVNKDYIAKATSYDFIFTKNITNVKLEYKDTKLDYEKDFEGNLKLEAKNMSDSFLNALLNKDLISGGNVNISAYGKNEIINGVAFIKNSKIKDLAVLNNLLILINTSPGLINPLLAIPSIVGMATTGGFNINGYRVIDGRIDFAYDFENKNLNMYRIFTKGNGVDFDGNANINFNSSEIESKLKLVFFKNYSKIVGEIPVINYLFLGDEKRVDTQVEIYGSLDDPKYKTNLAKDGVSAPVNFFKRLIESPKKIYDSINE